MASAITLPSAPNTGLTSLANVLLGSATEYAGRKQADKTEARRRAERLADIESDRAYADSNYEQARYDRLYDIGSERKDRDTREARKRDEQLDDIRDAQYWEKKIREEGLDDALAQQTRIGDAEAAIAARMDAREARRSAPEPEPTEAQVKTGALQLARQNSTDKDVLAGRKPPSTAEIAAALPEAAKNAQDFLFRKWQQDRLDDQQAQQIDTLRLTRLSTEKNVIISAVRRVAPPQPTASPKGLIDPVATPQMDAAAVRASFSTQVLGRNPGAAPDAPITTQPSRLFNPVDDPIIRAEQQARDTEATQSRLVPLQELQSKLLDIDSRIKEAQSTPPQPYINPIGGLGGIGMPTTVPRGQQAGVLSTLYTQQAELKKRLSALQDPTIAPAAAPVGAAWWMNPPQ